MAKYTRAIQHNAGTISYFEKKMKGELAALQRDIAKLLKEYEVEYEKEFASDAIHFPHVFSRLRFMRKSWLKRWRIFSKWMSNKVIDVTDRETTSALKQAFIDAGFTVKLDFRRIHNKEVSRLIRENVERTFHVAEKYLLEVEDLVKYAVNNGSDINFLAQKIGEKFNIINRKCTWLARDQVDKAGNAIQRVRDLELGIKEGIWVHVPGRYTSRKTHVAMNGQRFKLEGLDAGLYDSDVNKRVLPGDCYLCRCIYKRVIPEFGD